MVFSIRSLATALAQTVAAALCSAPHGAQPVAKSPAAQGPAPTLVVFITVDQLRADYLQRFYPQFTGGLKRLVDGGAVFTNAHQDHGTTETAPGHASTMSGRFPSHTGIVRNNAGVGDSSSPVIGSRMEGASPFRFRGTVLADWMRSRDPRTRVLSVSRKDRAAILPVGRSKAQQVLWYAPDSGGMFTTSRWYGDTLPAWVQRFNARHPAQQYAGRTWDLLLPASAYPEPDSVRYESNGVDYVFPHASPADPRRAAASLAAYPWMDDLTAAAALEGLQALDLGRGPQADLLAVSFSTTDAIGHRFGPDSRELHDQVIRLDRVLGAFIDSVYRLRDSSRVVFALTADHGVGPIPQVHFKGTDPARGRADPFPVLAAHLRRLMALGAPQDAIDFESGMVLFDRPALQAAHVSPDSLARAIAADLRRVPGILRVDFPRDLAGKAAKGDKFARRWLHSVSDDLAVGLLLTPEPYYYWTNLAEWDGNSVNPATHGTPHDYDTNVPVVFYGPPFRAVKVGEFARVVDMAPTLARVLGVTPTEPLDGVVLQSALR
jgi:predicted AlkP superfamily pyrophosphatase or phosphodiesterase